MSRIWVNDGQRWALLAPEDFDDEAALHSMVEDSPETLPLSGSPRLTVVGREVRLGSGAADLLAIDADGQLAVIEIKLARNAESRRAVVAQVLAYAAYLHGMDIEELQDEVLARHLSQRDFEDLYGAVAGNDGVGVVDRREQFEGEIRANLRDGRIRLVIVLDSAPEELVRIAGFLEAVADQLTIDLVTMSMYSVDGTSVLVPQRVDPGRTEPAAHEAGVPRRRSSTSVPGHGSFAEIVGDLPPSDQAPMQRLLDWAARLETQGLAVTRTNHNRITHTLQVRVVGYDAGMVTVAWDRWPCIWLYRSVFERFAPRALEQFEQHYGLMGRGTAVKDIPDDLLEIFEAAYVEAKETLQAR